MTLRFSYYRIRNYYYTGGHDCGGPDMEEDIRHLQRVAEFGSQEFCLEDVFGGWYVPRPTVIYAFTELDLYRNGILSVCVIAPERSSRILRLVYSILFLIQVANMVSNLVDFVSRLPCYLSYSCALILSSRVVCLVVLRRRVSPFPSPIPVIVAHSMFS